MAVQLKVRCKLLISAGGRSQRGERGRGLARRPGAARGVQLGGAVGVPGRAWRRGPRPLLSDGQHRRGPHDRRVRGHAHADTVLCGARLQARSAAVRRMPCGRCPPLPRRRQLGRERRRRPQQRSHGTALSLQVGTNILI